ncbi:hypothetical protein SERLADRAFT_439864 [Serpula lacrymans var. lacrymans S7.9]|nr:uncharacterized protein SERLADRAFT_439864 [Serpula lacrymans var. lacrymans S7.9]EGO23122.1 hypothetical protein SERLADRAFT_439864 [Serpula lacrymans var. lacrymans S7.9]
MPILINSGCTNSVIDQSLIDKYCITSTPLPVPLDTAGADGQSQKVMCYVTLHINVKGKEHLMDVIIALLLLPCILLGHDWLILTNPSIDWRANKITFPTDDLEYHLKEGDKILAVDLETQIIEMMQLELNTFATKSQQIAEYSEKAKSKLTFRDIFPPVYHKFEPIFTKESFNKLPPKHS